MPTQQLLRLPTDMVVRRKPAIIAVATAISCAYANGEAATVSIGLNVTASIQATCLVSVASLPFGVYTGSQIDATATITATCTDTTPYYVNVGDGLNSDASFYQRMIGPGGSLISHRFFQDAGRTIEWRKANNLDGKSGVGTGVVQHLTLYGRLLAGQFAIPGSYTDTVVVTVRH